MRQIQLQSKAKVDLLNIQLHTRETWGEDKELALLDEFDKAFENIATFPFLGRATRGKNVHVAILSSLPFVIVYKVDTTMIKVIQITHTKRNR